MIEQAKEFAINAHWGQMYGAKPYLYHLEEVSRIAKYFDLPEYVQAAAYLHDVVEDTDVHADQVCAEFGYDIATLVYAVTDPKIELTQEEIDKLKGMPLSLKSHIRNKRKAAVYPKILSHPYGVYLKLCDRIANVVACATAKDQKMFEKYCLEAIKFEKELKTPGIAEELWAELDKTYGKYKGQVK